jgi:hypothetical protein
VNLNFALGKTACGAFNGALYGLPDRSLVNVRFDGRAMVGLSRPPGIALLTTTLHPLDT